MAELAINGATPIRTNPYPRWPVWDDTERNGLLAVLDSGDWWATEGTKVGEFEAAWGRFHHTGPAAAVTNGTHAIELAFTALGVGEGDEVIVPAWSFLATASAALMVNAIPVFVDVDPRNGCIDVTAAEAAITDRTRAVAVVHVAGSVADMDALTDLCTRRGLAIVEDCAHAHGSTWNDQAVATLGDAGTFSFQHSKLMTAGEGGAVVSRRPDVIDEVTSLANCGRRPGQWFYSHYSLGGNYRLTEWQAAVLLAQLDRFPEQQARRSSNADYLNKALAEIPGVEPQWRDPRCTSQGNYCYVVRIRPDEFGAGREQVRLALEAEGIPLTMAYPPLHHLETFLDPDGFVPRFRSRAGMQDFGSLDLPVVRTLADETLWFKTAVLMGDRSDCDDVVAALARIQRNADELADLSVTEPGTGGRR
ncbi:MAG: DegT/DnrJ/EryC1/StrS family aminotransferase [Acidimicrobiia bacterium]|nr:DegT/DnrJ/EryC1/StrS family aminotransferase [Acidimicrobiia bacterium]